MLIATFINSPEISDCCNCDGRLG